MGWQRLVGSGLGDGAPGSTTGYVEALAALPNGDLVATGTFLNVGGIAATSIARWDGTDWFAFGPGLAGTTPWGRALAIQPSGDLVVGGTFIAAGGVAATNIASWNGDIVVGGIFTTAGGVVVNNVARWDGASWSPLGAGIPSNVNCLFVRPNGDLVAGGGAVRLSSQSHRSLGWLLLASPDNITVLVPVAGSTQSEFKLPEAPVLAGMPVFQQALQLDLVPLALTTSNALAMVLGSF